MLFSEWEFKCNYSRNNKSYKTRWMAYLYNTFSINYQMTQSAWFNMIGNWYHQSIVLKATIYHLCNSMTKCQFYIITCWWNLSGYVWDLVNRSGQLRAEVSSRGMGSHKPSGYTGICSMANIRQMIDKW